MMPIMSVRTSQEMYDDVILKKSGGSAYIRRLYDNIIPIIKIYLIYNKHLRHIPNNIKKAINEEIGVNLTDNELKEAIRFMEDENVTLRR